MAATLHAVMASSPLLRPALDFLKRVAMSSTPKPLLSMQYLPTKTYSISEDITYQYAPSTTDTLRGVGFGTLWFALFAVLLVLLMAGGAASLHQKNSFSKLVANTVAQDLDAQAERVVKLERRHQYTTAALKAEREQHAQTDADAFELLEYAERQLKRATSSSTRALVLAATDRAARRQVWKENAELKKKISDLETKLSTARAATDAVEQKSVRDPDSEPPHQIAQAPAVSDASHGYRDQARCPESPEGRNGLPEGAPLEEGESEQHETGAESGTHLGTTASEPLKASLEDLPRAVGADESADHALQPQPEHTAVQSEKETNEPIETAPVSPAETDSSNPTSNASAPAPPVAQPPSCVTSAQTSSSTTTASVAAATRTEKPYNGKPWGLRAPDNAPKGPKAMRPPENAPAGPKVSRAGPMLPTQVGLQRDQYGNVIHHGKVLQGQGYGPGVAPLATGPTPPRVQQPGFFPPTPPYPQQMPFFPPTPLWHSKPTARHQLLRQR